MYTGPFATTGTAVIASPQIISTAPARRADQEIAAAGDVAADMDRSSDETRARNENQDAYQQRDADLDSDPRHCPTRRAASDRRSATRPTRPLGAVGIASLPSSPR